MNSDALFGRLRLWWRSLSDVTADLARPATTVTAVRVPVIPKVMELVALQSLYDRYGQAVLERSAVDGQLAEDIGRHAEWIRELAVEGPPMGRTGSDVWQAYLMGHATAMLVRVLDEAVRGGLEGSPSATDTRELLVDVGALLQLGFEHGLIRITAQQ